MEKIEKTLFTIAAVNAATMGIGPLWALLGSFGGNWQIREEFP